MAHTPLALSVLLSLTICSAANAATVAGTVSDPDGRPVEGARIVLSSALSPLRTAETDERGAYDIRDVEAGAYELRVATPGLRAEPVAFTLVDDETRHIDVTLQVSAVAEEIVVSASTVEMPASIAPTPVTVIDRQRIDAEQLQDLAAALRSVPGIAATQSGTTGALVSVFPRGGESDYMLVLVDGIRLNTFGGGVDLGHVFLGDVDHIEVVRGPQSALFGADAMGGVIQIVTSRGGRPRATILGEAGARETIRASASAAGTAGAFDLGGGVEHLRTDGYTGLAADGERVSNDDYENTFASGRIAWRSARGSVARVDVKGGRNERGFPGPYGSDPGHTFSGVDRISRGTNVTRLVGAGVSHELAPRVQLGGHVHHADMAADFASPFGPAALDTRRTTARAQADVATTSWLSLSTGVEAHWERVESTFITDENFAPAPLDRSTVGVFAEGRVAAGRAALTSGVRIERLAKERLATYGRATTTSVNPRVGASLLVGATSRAWTRVRASAGTGIRAPDAFEIAFTTKPDLQPERSRSFDVGVEQGLRGGALVVEATAFYNRFADLIVAIGPALRGASQYTTDNIANARARGVELLLASRTAWGFNVRVTTTLLDTDILAVDLLPDVAPAPFRVGDRLLRRPRVQGSVDASYIGPRITGFVQVGARGRVLEVDPSFGASGGLFEGAGFGYVNAGAGVRLTQSIDAFARVSNVLDNAYEEALGYPAPDRSAFVGVRFAPGR